MSMGSAIFKKVSDKMGLEGEAKAKADADTAKAKAVSDEDASDEAPKTGPDEDPGAPG